MARGAWRGVWRGVWRVVWMLRAHGSVSVVRESVAFTGVRWHDMSVVCAYVLYPWLALLLYLAFVLVDV